MKTIKTESIVYRCDFCQYESNSSIITEGHECACHMNPKYEQSKRVYQMTINLVLKGGQLSTDEFKSEMYRRINDFVLVNRDDEEIDIDIIDYWGKDCKIKEIKL